MAERTNDTHGSAGRRGAAARRALLGAGLALAATLATPLAAPTPAMAQDAAKTDVPAPVAATIAKLTGGKAKILQAFKTPTGLIGVALTVGSGHNTILYATPDGKYLVQGMMISSDGQNLTKQAAAQYLPQPATAAQNLAAIDKAQSYLWGKADAKKEMWIVFDPNCIFCHKTFNDLKPDVASGKLKVHIIQVGFLKPSSLGKAAAILSAKDPVSALTVDETKFDTDKEEGGIAPDTSNAKAVAEVKANNEWMNTQGITGTPYLLYRDTSGKPKGVTGYVSDTAGLLSDIATAG